MSEIARITRSVREKVGQTCQYYLKPGSLFKFDGNYYPYFKHEYNTTWANERAVEVPAAMGFIHRHDPAGEKAVLEVGNVLSHYHTFAHDVVDKYEQAKGVVNVDVVEYLPQKQYDLIVSISTLEHVGWDEEVKEPGKILQAISHLKTLLKPGGKMLITLPLGYNQPMDRQIGEGQIDLGRHLYLKRVSDDNCWQQVGWKDVDGIQYGVPYKFANGLLIGIFEK